ncbi:MAG: four-carbon acid sugar kinase family protein [Candidatus Hadarchaeum sp.]|uniref:four-carbon acid sugar kinase family protein n=1 Tax=Candidatus Hadarchaeum sp. TaxID=2883567 RepID=UPI0031713F4F
MRSPRLAIIGDDLTGTAISAAQFANHGIQSFVFVAPPLEHNVTPAYEKVFSGQGVVGINTNTRLLDPSNARTVVFYTVQFLVHQGYNFFVKFFDSNLRGNIAAEIGAACDALHISRTIIIPGTPQAGRVVKNGLLLINGVPIHFTHFALDPLNPIQTPNVTDIIAFSHATIAHITISNAYFKRLLTAPAHVTSQLLFQRYIYKLWRKNNILLFDAPNMKAIEITVANLLPLFANEKHVLICGSLGLVTALSNIISRSASLCDDVLLSKKRKTNKILIVSGSASSRTLQQLRLLKNIGVPIICLDVSCLESQAYINNTAYFLNEILKAKSVAVLTSALDRAQIRKGKIALKGDLSKISVSIAEVTKKVIENMADINELTLIVIGGLTAYNVLEKLGIKCLKIKEEKNMITYTSSYSGPYEEMQIATKGGAAGNKVALKEVIASVMF